MKDKRCLKLEVGSEDAKGLRLEGRGGGGKELGSKQQEGQVKVEVKGQTRDGVGTSFLIAILPKGNLGVYAE